MASNASYPRKYYSVAYAELNSIPLKEGNVIATYDSDGFYYDVGNPAGSGSDVVRRKANGIEFVDALYGDDDTKTYAREEAVTIFVVENGEMLDENGNTVKSYSGYRWNADLTPQGFEEVFNNLRDYQVKSISNSTTQAYIVGSTSANDNVGTLIKNPNIYLTATGNKIHADLDGTADKATNATNASNAAKATNDRLGQDITSYIRAVADSTVNNATVFTFTRGNGTTFDIPTINTQYGIFNANDAGLVSKTNGVSPSATDSTGLILTGSGWIPKANIDVGTATSAINDQQGQEIDSTYIKDGSYNTSTEKLTLVYGDSPSHTKEISIPDTKYSVFTSGTDGLVPAASATGAADMFLRGNGQWSGVFAVGSVGLVPAPTNNDTAKYLRGDHTWQDLPVFAGSTAGLVPTAQTGDANKYLKGDGTWAEGNDTLNTAGSNQDAAKLYLVGAKSQTTGTSGVQTYSNANAYTQNGKLYSNSDEVVTLSGSQALTNKTYEGYHLGAACSKPIANTIAEIATDNFTGDGSTTAFTLTNTAQSIADVYIDGSLVTSGYSLNTSTNTVTFTSAPANDASIIIDYYDAAYDANALTPAGTVASYLPTAIASAVNNAGLVDAGVVADIYDDSLSYSAGDYRTHQVPGSVYKLYCCNASTSGTFDPTKWDEVSVADVLVRVPAPPTTDGTYSLKVTVSSGVPTFSWV